MSFDPTGGWDTAATPLPEALANGKTFFHSLPTIANGLITRLYLHWAVAGYCNTFTDYNGMVIQDSAGKWELTVTHDPRDNAPGVNNKAQASHTWHRNTGALGISVAGMTGATENNFGSCPINFHELEFLAAGAAAFALKYGLDALGTVAVGETHTDNNGNTVNTKGETVILTHGEAAVIDAYPTERWDLGSLVPLPDGVSLTPAMRTISGNALRQRIHVYKAALS